MSSVKVSGMVFLLILRLPLIWRRGRKKIMDDSGILLRLFSFTACLGSFAYRASFPTAAPFCATLSPCWLLWASRGDSRFSRRCCFFPGWLHHQRFPCLNGQQELVNFSYRTGISQVTALGNPAETLFSLLFLFASQILIERAS